MISIERWMIVGTLIAYGVALSARGQCTGSVAFTGPDSDGMITATTSGGSACYAGNTQWQIEGTNGHGIGSCAGDGCSYTDISKFDASCMLGHYTVHYQASCEGAQPYHRQLHTC